MLCTTISVIDELIGTKGSSSRLIVRLVTNLLLLLYYLRCIPVPVEAKGFLCVSITRTRSLRGIFIKMFI